MCERLRHYSCVAGVWLMPNRINLVLYLLYTAHKKPTTVTDDKVKSTRSKELWGSHLK